MSDLDLTKLVRMDEGLLSALVVCDPEIYRLELERIFGQAWLFVGHGSEVPQAGDFVTRRMGEERVIMWHGADGVVRVFLNACRHRGRDVCPEDMGRAARLRCPYHGWTYDSSGQLVGVPFAESYQGQLNISGLGLLAAPRVEAYHGLYFASWASDGQTLAEYLAGMTWVLDMLAGRTEDVEIVGPPMRWQVSTNWKIPSGNFAGDGYHLATTHGFSHALDLKAKRGERVGHGVDFGNGHTAAMTAWATADQSENPYQALPESLWPEIASRLTPSQHELFKNLQVIVGNIFPNLSMLATASHPPGEWAGPEGRAMSFYSLRQWQPLGPDRIEAWSWLLVDGAAPAEWKELSRTLYQRVFGPGGVFEQDDVENWSSISRALRSPKARGLWHHYDLVLEQKSSTEWNGPGIAHRQEGTFSEMPERAFYRRWLQLMTVEQPSS